MTARESLEKLVSQACPPVAATTDCTQVLVGIATCAIAAGADEAAEGVREALVEAGSPADLQVYRVGCVGRCGLEPLVEVRRPGQAPRMYVKVNKAMAREIVRRDILQGEPIAEWQIDLGERPDGEPCDEETCEPAATLSTSISSRLF